MYVHLYRAGRATALNNLQPYAYLLLAVVPVGRWAVVLGVPNNGFVDLLYLCVNGSKRGVELNTCIIVIAEKCVAPAVIEKYVPTCMVQIM
jgi:hypothetical protein